MKYSKFETFIFLYRKYKKMKNKNILFLIYTKIQIQKKVKNLI